MSEIWRKTGKLSRTNLHEGFTGLFYRAVTKKLLVRSEYVFARGAISNELPPMHASEDNFVSGSFSYII
jgi:hypothetical protein